MAPAPETVRTRITSIDVLRGAVMVLMAIDHVRVYSGVPAGGPTPACSSPAGSRTSARRRSCSSPEPARFCTGGRSRLADRRPRARALPRHARPAARAPRADRHPRVVDLRRRLLGVHPRRRHLDARLVHGPAGGLDVAADVGGRRARADRDRAARMSSACWGRRCRNRGGRSGNSSIRSAPRSNWARTDPSIAVLYTIVPWIGVMAAGYGFGAVMVRDAAPSDAGSVCGSGWPRPRCSSSVAGARSVSIGPAADERTAGAVPVPEPAQVSGVAAVPADDARPGDRAAAVGRARRGWIADVLATFGRVPMFYYLLHIPLIHALALVVWLLRDGTAHPEWFATAPFVSMASHRWGLPLLYLVFAIAVTILYFPCRWFVSVKASGRHGWLRYV